MSFVYANSSTATTATTDIITQELRILSMDKVYLHTNHEDRLYAQWEKSGAFAPTETKKTDKPSKKPFTIIMPPPNANDPLHIGHAMFVALEDVLIRYHRMLGERALWLPGTDHAGIETQFVFEKKLKKNDQSRFQFDRDTLYKMIWEYVQENSDIAVNQLKKLGASADWSRFTFTLDPKVVRVVLDTFQELYEKKLIYRDYRLVNYCTKCGTAFSELEVKHVEQTSPLYYMKYGPFTIATTRPETKFRDTALAVNPKDPRYKDWLDKSLDIPGLLGSIKVKIIADDGVDMEFGTGIMKVTPAHDMHDFELGKKYNLPVTPIIDFQGRMDFSWFLEQPNIANVDEKYRQRAEKYHRKKIAEVRKLMVEDLKEEGLLVKIDENYTHSVGVCYRCGTVIEPLPLPQFFISVKPLTKAVLQAQKKKEFRVFGAGHDKILKHWLENLKDWNISRQIVWGIRMPIWYSVEKNPDLLVTFLNDANERISGKISELLKQYSLAQISAKLQEMRVPVSADFIVSQTNPGENFLQETDTFDTWFSSSQWPFATLMANQPDDFSQFYPTQVMETGYDILPFWVMRMLMMGIFKTGKTPFTSIYLHGLVRDEKGKKMSKSKGNVINPLTIIDKYGADALRMALIIRSSAGLDKSVGEGDFKAMRNFTNKIWNAARFVLLRIEEETQADSSKKVAGFEGDLAFYAHLNQIVADVTQQLNDFKIGLAAETVYNEFWHWYCDQMIEEAKTNHVSNQALLDGLIAFLKLIHPFMPFVSEAVWQQLPDRNELLISSPWPTAIMKK
jgi:valyl-tRNA synthetase